MAAEEKNQESERISKNDKITILILLILYVLQGIPIGLGISIRLLLQNKNVSYKDQAMFSLVFWPYSLKLLWAPIVDSLYWKCMGRRKSWLIPTQYVLGFFMLILSTYVSSFFGDVNNPPDVFSLTVAFFCLYFLCATQDIAVDGWALTMLSRKNVGFAAICNSVGLRAGMLFGSVIFLVLESPEFCNQYLRSVPQPEGFVTLAGFLKVSGVVFLFSTTAVLIFKSEPEEKSIKTLGLMDTYKQVYHIMCLKNVILLLIFLMTYPITLAAVDSVCRLKFIEAGLRKENMALLEIPLIPVEILFPLYISRRTTGINPLNLFLKAFPYKLIFGVIFAILVWWTYFVKLESGAFPNYYYVVIVLISMLHQVPSLSLHLSIGSFLNRVSDPAIGSTYMTLLNTFSNLGRNWSGTVALWLVDVLTFKKCENPIYNCDNNEAALKCTGSGHSCVTVFDGYYIETVACVIFGILWLRWGQRVALKLQGTLLSEWKTSQYAQLQSLESDSIRP